MACSILKIPDFKTNKLNLYQVKFAYAHSIKLRQKRGENRKINYDRDQTIYFPKINKHKYKQDLIQRLFEKLFKFILCSKVHPIPNKI